MKQKFILFIASILMMQLAYGQEKKNQSNLYETLYADNGISEISIQGNIDLVLIQGSQDDVSIKVKENTFPQLTLKIDGETLIISPRNVNAIQERIIVYVTINELRRLTLMEDAFATTRGKLSTKYLQVTILDNAKMQLGTKGRVIVDTPDNYQVLKESQYVSAQAIKKS